MFICICYIVILDQTYFSYLFILRADRIHRCEEKCKWVNTCASFVAPQSVVSSCCIPPLLIQDHRDRSSLCIALASTYISHLCLRTANYLIVTRRKKRGEVVNTVRRLFDDDKRLVLASDSCRGETRARNGKDSTLPVDLQ